MTTRLRLFLLLLHPLLLFFSFFLKKAIVSFPVPSLCSELDAWYCPSADPARHGNCHTTCLIKGARNASRHVHRLVLLAFAKKTLIFDWHSSQYTIHGVFCPALACRWWAFLCDLSMHDDCRLQRHSPFETRPAWWNFATKNALIGQNEHMTTLGMVQAGGATRSRLARIPSKCQVSLPTTKSNLIASPRPRIHSTAPPPSLPWADVIIHPSCRHHRLWAANVRSSRVLCMLIHGSWLISRPHLLF